MITSATIDRINILMQQGRYDDASNLVDAQLQKYPEDTYAKYIKALILFNKNEIDKSRKLTDLLLQEDPTNTSILMLSVEIDIEAENYIKAESKAELILELDPENVESHLIYTKLKLNQRNYDRALNSANKALELDAENLEALNYKIAIERIIGSPNPEGAIKNALELDPENPNTIANHGIQLLREEKVEESLERLKYALNIDPNNTIAQYGMQEALKSRFWPYRMFTKLQELSGRLSGRNLWYIIIGAYVFNRMINTIANNVPSLAPFLKPIFYFIVFLFYLSWILNPLMNLYLMTNKYGRHLLSKNEKTSSILVGSVLAMAIVCLIIYLTTDYERIIILGVVFLVSMIPFSSFLSPSNIDTRRNIIVAMSSLLGLALIGFIININILIYPYFIAVFIYQFVINNILIKENARVFD